MTAPPEKADSRSYIEQFIGDLRRLRPIRMSRTPTLPGFMPVDAEISAVVNPSSHRSADAAIGFPSRGR
jgi:hypothetical protein